MTILNFIEGAFPNDEKNDGDFAFLCIVFLTAALFFIFWKSPLYANAASQTAHDHTSEWKAYTAGEPIEAGTDFFVSGLLQDGNYLFSYSDNADGVYRNGLPKGVGTWYVRAAALCKTE